MSTYAIGDVQGCFKSLMRLLDHIHFNEHQDTLWFTGDLINRGPQSLETVQFIKNLKPNKAIIVLGNHDLHFLSVFYHPRHLKSQDTFLDLLHHPNVEDYAQWLREQPLLHCDSILNFNLVHAGILPLWDLNEAQQYAKEIQNILRSDKASDFLAHLYGNEPTRWNPYLNEYERFRFILNAFTRLRFCNEQSVMNLKNKTNLPENTSDIPWFNVANRKTKHHNIIFGHWAALMGQANTPHIFALDTGCVWGKYLTALRLEDSKFFHMK